MMDALMEAVTQDCPMGTQDDRGQWIAGTETMRLVHHQGKLFAEHRSLDGQTVFSRQRGTAVDGFGNPGQRIRQCAVAGGQGLSGGSSAWPP